MALSAAPLLVRTVAHPFMWVSSAVVAVMLKQPEVMVAPIVGTMVIEGVLEKLFT